VASDNPYPAPAPLVLSRMCARAAWQQDIPDATRMLLEWAADTLREVVERNHTLCHKAEQLEGDAALLFHQLYGPQKGGAA
jgi:hypothetical protein